MILGMGVSRSTVAAGLVALGLLIAPPAAPASLLDAFLPTSHYRNTRSIRVQAPPAAVLAAVRAVTPAEVPGLTAFVAASNAPRFRLTPAEGALFRRPMIEALERQRFVVLGERAGQEIVMGAIGRIWAERLLPLRGPAAFRSFRDPRFARVAMNVLVRGDARGGTVLTTETRILCPDPVARRRLDRYWRLWSPGGAVVRDRWLATVRHRAEAAVRRKR